MAVDTALFVLGLDTVGVPTPLAVSTFQLDGRNFRIGGVAKTLADLWPDLGILTVTDAGLECNYAGGAGTASQTAIGSGALFAAVKPIPGNTAVFDIDLVHDPLDAASFETRVDLVFDDGTPATVSITAQFNQDVNRVIFSHLPDAHTALSGALVNGFNRIAVSFDEALCAVSANGSAITSFVPTIPPSFAGFTEVSLFFSTQSVLRPSLSRLRKIRWLPLQSNLQALSAL